MKPTMIRNRLMASVVAISAVAAVALTNSTSAVSASPPELSAGVDRPGLRATLQQDADALLRQGAPGVLVELQTDRGELKVRSGYGNTETGSPVPRNARFRIGSLTKPFVAATVLQLVGEHRLSLEDTVDRWLPGLVRGRGNDGRDITVRQLLQHTSGLPEYVQALTYMFNREGFEQHRFDTVTARKAVRLAMRYRPDFEAGTSWSYSNTGYALAGLIIEKVTGRSWQAEVRRRIVRPLGLDDTTLPGTRVSIPGPHAIGYERFPGPGATAEDLRYGDPIDATEQNPSWGGAAGEIISTTDDTNRFLQALVRGRVLRPAQLAEMQRTVPVNAAFRHNWPGARYGLGLMWIPTSCGGSWSHGGDIAGFMTRNGVTPDGDRSVMVTMNTDSFDRDPGVPAPTRDITGTLIEHALCGS